MIECIEPAANSAKWEHFPHDADIGVRGIGRTAAEAFEEAAYALTATVTQAKVAPKLLVEVRCESPDVELLFVEWLNTIIYEMAVRRMLFGRFAVRIEGLQATESRVENLRLEGRLWGEPVDVARHRPACEPKGATYTALKVGLDDNGIWTAGCVVDV
ncbi:archease [Methylocella tundrae]|uniref:Archease n=1 Tax=Methylocella tundrae TaxID=227605 RepID=A0A4U8Z730_METTU|nr:archease [Methylocella tundrae]WPP02953.1 archease [Methylocella tundrae]VFU16638.1 Archease [Methylocella tundrae]